MELGHTYVLLDCVVALLLAAVLMTVLVCTVIQELRKPSAHEQRLLQIQLKQVQREREMSELTHDYIQRASAHAQQQLLQKDVARTRSRSNHEVKPHSAKGTSA